MAAMCSLGSANLVASSFLLGPEPQTPRRGAPPPDPRQMAIGYGRWIRCGDRLGKQLALVSSGSLHDCHPLGLPAFRVGPEPWAGSSPGNSHPGSPRMVPSSGHPRSPAPPSG